MSLALSATIAAQPEFSVDKIRESKGRITHPEFFDQHALPETPPMPAERPARESISSSGNLDATFNASVTEGNGYVDDLVVQPDGKIVIAGSFRQVNGTRVNNIARLNADGSLDNSFGLPTSGFYGDIYDFEIQPDGKFVIGGNFVGGQNFSAYAGARINQNGSFDVDLNTNLTLLFLPAYDITLQPDNKILVGGQILDLSSSSTSPAIVRFNPDGSMDTGFTAARMFLGSQVRAMTVQPSGKIIIGGTFAFTPEFPRNGMARLNSNGTLDGATFSGNGGVFALAQQADGSIYGAVIRASRNTAPKACLMRLSPPTPSIIKSAPSMFRRTGKFSSAVFSQAIAERRRSESSGSMPAERGIHHLTLRRPVPCSR